MVQILFMLAVFTAALSAGFSRDAGGSHGLPEPRQWLGWKARYRKSYTTIDEDFERRLVWTKNQQLIDAHNREFEMGRTSFMMAMNEFGDQDAASIGRKLIHSTRARTSKQMSNVPSSSPTRPSSWDWRKKGAVLPVENQGMVDAALAIDTADAVASFSFIHDATSLERLSIQEVVDCCLPDPILEPTVFDCIKEDGGLCANGSYHSGSGPNPCNVTSCKPVAFVDTGGKEVKDGDENALADAVLTTPVIVGIDASQPSFQFYVSGVYSDPNCSKTQLDHVLIAVGYGIDNASGIEYWICKNTWGTSWGEEGYIRIARNKDNVCGIATMPIYPY